MPPMRKQRVDLTRQQATELARLCRDRPDITTDELARRFGVARVSVSGIVRRYGVKLRSGPPRIPPAEATRIVDLYRDRALRAYEIAQLVGHDRATIQRLITRAVPGEDRRGIGPFPNHPRRYKYRPDLFDDPLSEGEMWLFGLLLADGTTDGRWRIVLRLAAADRDGVEQARAVAGSDAPITTIANSGSSPSGGPGQDLVCWVLYSHEIVSRVAELGMLQAKSYRSDIRVPGRIASSPSFWRGLVDGDGTACWNRKRTADGRVKPLAWLQVLGGEELLRQWAEFVVNAIGGASPQVRRKPGTNVLCVSVLSGSRAWRMLRMLYCSDGPALARKRSAAEAILAESPPTPRPIPRDEVQRALRAFGRRRLSDIPYRYVCPETGVRLGRLVEHARAGQRPDLHGLFAAHDPDWQTSGKRPRRTA